MVLSDGRVECRIEDERRPERDGRAFGVDVRALTTGFGCSGCVARASGAVECWSYRRDGSPGDASGVVRGVGDVVQLASGRDHACAVQGDGRLLCWTLRWTEPGTDLDLQAAEYLAGLRVEQVAVGLSHSCALVETGAVFCWGSNDWGQLGDDSTEDRSTPVAVHGITDAVQVAVASLTTCAVRRSGAVSCSGTATTSSVSSSSRLLIPPSPRPGPGRPPSPRSSAPARPCRPCRSCR